MAKSKKEPDFDPDTGEVIEGEGVENEDGPRSTSFSRFFSIANHGEPEAFASEKLAELLDTLQIRAAEKGGRAKGSISVTASVTVDEGMLDITFKTEITTPKEAPKRAFLYLDADGNPTDRDPHQRTFRFVDNEDGGTKTKTV